MDQAAFNVEQTAATLGVGRTVTYRLIATGELRSITVGRRRLVPASAITDFLTRRLDEQTAAPVDVGRVPVA